MKAPTSYPDKVRQAHGAASLWRYLAVLQCYALVWPDEEPELEAILRRQTMTPADQGAMWGAYLYTH